MSYPTFHCDECGRLRNEVEALKGALTAAHDDVRAADTRGWNAAIDAALTILKFGYFAAKIKELKRPEI